MPGFNNFKIFLIDDTTYFSKYLLNLIFSYFGERFLHQTTIVSLSTHSKWETFSLANNVWVSLFKSVQIKYEIRIPDSLINLSSDTNLSPFGLNVGCAIKKYWFDFFKPHKSAASSIERTNFWLLSKSDK